MVGGVSWIGADAENMDRFRWPRNLDDDDKPLIGFWLGRQTKIKEQFGYEYVTFIPFTVRGWIQAMGLQQSWHI
jgi:hypothetical protein